MSGGLSGGQSGGSTEDQYEDSPGQPTVRSGPQFLGLSRCAACYNHRADSMRWRGGDGESSSSAEDSGPEVDWDSEAESSSSSSCSGQAFSEMHKEPETEEPSHVSGDAAEPESGGKDGDGPEDTGEMSQSQEDKNKTKGVTRRAPLVKSFSLPASLTPHLTPLTLLPRPHTVVSTLHLQVLSQKHDSDIIYIAKQNLSQGEEEKTKKGTGGGHERLNNLVPPQMELPWKQRSQPALQQHQLSYQYQQQPQQMSHQHHQQPQHFPPHSAQGQRLPPPLHTLPVLHPPTLHTHPQAPYAPLTHLHALTPQPCWQCYSTHFPYFPYWSH